MQRRAAILNEITYTSLARLNSEEATWAGSGLVTYRIDKGVQVVGGGERG